MAEAPRADAEGGVPRFVSVVVTPDVARCVEKLAAVLGQQAIEEVLDTPAAQLGNRVFAAVRVTPVNRTFRQSNERSRRNPVKRMRYLMRQRRVWKPREQIAALCAAGTIH